MTVKGNPVSPGIAIGEVFIYKPFTPVVCECRLPKEEIPENLERYERAKAAAGEELKRIVAQLGKEDPEKAKIFEAHQAILEDIAIEEEVQRLIREEGFAPDYAVNKAYDTYIEMFDAIEDELIRERAADLRDVRTRLLRCWAGVEEVNLAALDKDYVIVAADLFPSDTATLNRKRVLAILTEVGGATSHSAIIARSYEIPAVLGIPDALKVFHNGGTVVVDAVKGLVIADPTEEERELYSQKREKFLIQMENTKKYLGIVPYTADHTHIDVNLNIGSANDEELAGSKHTDGVGLFRTEFLYMGKPQLPTEEEQFEVYAKVLNTYGSRPVVLRTLDIGGDKQLSSMQLPKEDNPFLGNRALRLCFAHPALFKTQLRAALRASVHGNLWIMLPMVGSMDDIRRAKEFVEEVKAELTAAHIPYNPDYKLGIMVEIPSIALIADMAAKEVDFASIGSNDLCQYMTAVDRLNPNVSGYYQSYHPAMFRLMGYVVREFQRAGKSVSICGELGGDPLAAAVLIGLGMRKLSMGLASVAPIKKMLSGLTIARAEELAKTAVGLSSADEVRAYLEQELGAIL